MDSTFQKVNELDLGDYYHLLEILDALLCASTIQPHQVYLTRHASFSHNLLEPQVDLALSRLCATIECNSSYFESTNGCLLILLHWSEHNPQV